MWIPQSSGYPFRKLKNKKPVALSIAALVLIVIVGVSALSGNSKVDASSPAGLAPQAMSVEVALIKVTKARIWREFSGRLAAVGIAEIRPQVSGTITEIRFADGQHVEQGDVLYVIDPRPFNAAVQQARSEVASSRNANTLAQSVLKRAEELIRNSAISQRIYDERANDVLVTEAAIQGAEARLEQALINLGYAYIKAPISGRTNRAEITLGNLVSSGPTAPLLITIVSDSGIYAEFEVDEKTYMDHIHVVAGIRNNELKIPVKFFIGSPRKRYEGFIHSIDNRIDPSSGTIRARAFFENEDAALIPGMFVRVNVGSAEIQDNIFLRERAVGTNQNQKFVYVVSTENTVEYREIHLGESLAGSRVILSGLEEGEMVITAGLMRIRPGMPVAPQVGAVADEPSSENQLAAAP